MNERLTRDGVLAKLHTQRFGQALIVTPVTQSTNTDLRRMAEEGAPEGTTLIALSQSGGRGRRGRCFHSPEGGLYLSTLLRPCANAPVEAVTSCAAVAAARAIERVCDIEVGIKWVNDLYVRGRKVCGILAEGGFAPDGQIAYILLGFGVNVAPCEMPAELKDIATSLGNECDPPAIDDLAAALLEEWEHAYDTLSHGSFWEESRRRSIVLGREVTVMRGEETFLATAVAITNEGHLLVRTPDGERELSSGEVSLRL